ncbi:MCP four helix bundle domain-containing protein [Pseudomonas sp. FP1742]|uniref:MCP four helix bundle domain-containing protein n=1 Tax=Pseudomonas sp. FP1742 TaxID=2954079 RepID=UPI00351EBFF4
MNILSRSKFSTKLLTAFVFCALITLLAGAGSILSINRLSTALALTFSDNLVSVGKIGETLSSLTAHNRGMYRLLDGQRGVLPDSENHRLHEALVTDLNTAKNAYASYRATPLQDDERAAGDKLDLVWPTYISTSQKIVD